VTRVLASKGNKLAIADKPRDAFRGQSRSPNIPYSIRMVSYCCAIVTLLWP